MIKVILDEGLVKPEYKTAGASGLDVSAVKLIAVFKSDNAIDEDKLKILQQNFLERGFIKLRGFERAVFGTGITVADMSNDVELVVRPRSGMSTNGFIVANSPGTIDSDYRGEIGVILTNNTPFLNKIEKGERVAQIVIQKKVVQDIEVVTETYKTVTERGSNGYGSTGKK